MPRKNAFRLSPLPIEAQFSLAALARRIAGARKQRALTQRDMAEMLGISKTTYNAIEAGLDTVQIGHYCRAIWMLDIAGTFLPMPDDDMSLLQSPAQEGR